MESKWIYFEEYPFTEGKTKKFFIKSRQDHSIIGLIKWYAPWRKYSFFPYHETVFETTCLKDIIAFIEKIMLDRKTQKQN